MAHMCICHDSFIYVPWLMYMWHDLGADALPFKLHSREVWRIQCVRHDSFMHVPRLIQMCAMTLVLTFYPAKYILKRHGAFVCVPWIIHTCAMTCSYVCRDSDTDVLPFKPHSRKIRLCAMTHLYMCCDSFVCDGLRCYYSHYILDAHGAFICVPWLTYMCHDSFVCDGLRYWHATIHTMR